MIGEDAAPRTKAGRALLADAEAVGAGNLWQPGDPQHIASRILAIEAEAAQGAAAPPTDDELLLRYVNLPFDQRAAIECRDAILARLSGASTDSTDSEYFLVVKDDAGNPIRLDPIEAEPIIEDGEVVGYVSRERER